MIYTQGITESAQDQVDINSPSMGAWAQRYAAAGWAVFPLHNAIFDEHGHCTGCTCEAYRHTAECKRDHPHLYLEPDQRCEQPGKCPRVRWRAKSTRDPEQIRRWWKAWPNAPIGCDMGKSGLLAVDLDTYKARYAGGEMHLDEQTLKSLTGGGGAHLIYSMPHGKHYGNRTGTLPAGIDIRGDGGYIVLPPSLHKSGRRYAWAEGHSPWEIQPAPLPDKLAEILEAAMLRAAVPDVQFGTDVDAPDLEALGLPASVLDAIHSAPSGDRSAADFAVVAALARAGLDDDAIRAVYRTYPIGGMGKYAQRGDPYLALTIANVRAKVGAVETALSATLANWRGLANGPAFVEHLRADTLRKPEGYRALILALVQMAEQYQRLVFVPGLRKLGELCGISHIAARNRLAKLAAADLVAVTRVESGLQVDLTQCCSKLTLPLDPSPIPTNCGECKHTATFENHMADDAFSDYPHRYAAAHWPGRETARALGVNALAIWDAIDRYGSGTVKRLATVTGLSIGAARAATKRLDNADLLIAWKAGRAWAYDLHPDFDNRLDDLRDGVATHGIGVFRSMRNDLAAAAFAERQRTSRKKQSEGEVRRWAERRDRADRKASAKRTYLESIGFVLRPARPAADEQGVPTMPKPQTTRFDAAEEWRSKYKDIYGLWCELEGDDNAKLVQMMYLHNGQDLDAEGWAKLRAHISGEVQSALSLARRAGRFTRLPVDDYFEGKAPPRSTPAQSDWLAAGHVPTMRYVGAEVAA